MLVFQKTVFIKAYKQAAQMLLQCRDTMQKSEQHTGWSSLHNRCNFSFFNYQTIETY